jgi:uncharacterized protein (TIGR03435 family)
LLLVAAAIAAVIGLPTAQTPAPGAALPAFEVASVKPNTSGGPGMRIGFQPGGRFTASNMTLREMIRIAYQVQPFQLTGGPGWIDSERFDVTAKAEGDVPPAQMWLMMRTLVAERFNVAVRHETREMPIYALVLARSDGRMGERLRPAGPDCLALTIPAGMPAPPPPPGGPGRGGPGPAGRGPGGPGGPGSPGSNDPNGPPACPTIFGPGFMSARRTTMAQFARGLANQVRRVIVDRTGLTGNFDADLEFTPEFRPPAPPDAPPINIPSDGPSIFTALQEQLGLKLDSHRGPVEMVVVERAEELIPD